MQQRLMLRRRPLRRRNRRHRLNALALARHHQTCAFRGIVSTDFSAS
jgi:hypothetical protein